MLDRVGDVEGFALIMTMVMITAAAVRAVVFGIETGRAFVVLGSWLVGMGAAVAALVALPALVGGWRPLLSGPLVLAFVREHDLPLAALLVIGTLASTGLDMLVPARQSAASEARA